MPRALVTGATGFIGSHLVERLLRDGVEARCLVRSPQRAAGLRSLGATVVPGDVTVRESLSAAVADVDVVYHLAGATLAFTARTFRKVNAEGTANLAAACGRRPSPPIFVYVSSLAAAGPSPFDQPRSEDDPPEPVSLYGASKRAGEQRLETIAREVPITVLRPPIVFGPRERHVLDLFRFVHRGWQPVPYFGQARLSFIHVYDLVEAMIRAAASGRRLTAGAGFPGVYHVAAPEQLTLEELGERVAEAMHQPRGRCVRIPGWLCRSAAVVADVGARLVGRPTLLNSDKMREAAAGSWICRVDRAANDLGFRPAASLLERLRQTAEWYCEHGWL